MINQLFHNKPSFELINKIINIIGFDSIYTNKRIFQNDLKQNNIVLQFNDIIDEIKANYLSCKEDYCNNLNEKKCITITRQHLKTINYDLLSEIAYINSKRHITYRIVQSKIKKNIQKGLEFNISFT
jgi:hypothetical protein